MNAKGLSEYPLQKMWAFKGLAVGLFKRYSLQNLRRQLVDEVT
jgi:hypothetical protein